MTLRSMSYTVPESFRSQAAAVRKIVETRKRAHWILFHFFRKTRETKASALGSSAEGMHAAILDIVKAIKERK